MTTPPRVRFGALDIDLLDLPSAVALIADLVGQPGPALVMTPNMHRYSLVVSSAVVRRAYAAATLVLPDGWPIVSVLRRRPGGAGAEQVCGSDLLPRLLGTAAGQGLTVALIGGSDPHAAAAAARRAHPALRIVHVDGGRYSSPPSPEQVERFLGLARQHAPDLLVLGLGAPKEEALAVDVLPHLARGVVLCLGGSIDFLSGHQRRAPVLVRCARLEWAWRSGMEPSRLWHRYVKPLPAFLRAAVGPQVPSERGRPLPGGPQRKR